jgi:hypothetical protein
VVNAASGADGIVQLDLKISAHQISYGDRTTADSVSRNEARTARQHEYAHVGARNALASSMLLTALCRDVGVQWKFHINTTNDQSADQASLAATRKTFESAVEDYINLLVGYLDEPVVHETQRNATTTGVKSASEVKTLLDSISYDDPVTGTSKKPSTAVMAQSQRETRNGATKDENFARSTPTPAAVKPLPP